jgi:type II secretory pathway pseudopilin PulG
MYHRCSQTRLAAFTLVELLVVIAIVMAVLALLFPAVQLIRETANKAACANNLRNIGVAISLYTTAHRRQYPTGGGDVVRNKQSVPRSWAGSQPATGAEQDWGWAYQILPYLDETGLWLRPAAEDGFVAASPVSGYFCPSRRGRQVISNQDSDEFQGFGDRAAIDYAGNMGAFTYVMPNGQLHEP